MRSDMRGSGSLCRGSIRPLIVLAAVSVFLVTACTSESGTPSAGGTGSPTAPPDLTRFLLGPDEEPGFAPAEEPTTFSSIDEAFDEGPEADKERATKDGFQALAFQPLEGEAGAGITNVFLFATEEGANSWLRYRTGQEFPETFSRFSVPGVPRAQGFAGTFEGHNLGNVLWTQGRCQLTLGNQANEGEEASVEALQAAVKAIYERTDGSCP